jgi:hypothetical protein
MTPEQKQIFISRIRKFEEKAGRKIGRDEFDRFHGKYEAELAAAPKEPSLLDKVDTGLSKASEFAKEKIAKAQENPLIANRMQRWGDILKIGGYIPGKIMHGVDAVEDMVGIPHGPAMADALPKTSESLGVNPNTRDLGNLLLLEGLGRGASKLKSMGEAKVVKAFEDGKPPPPSAPPGAPKEIAHKILNKESLALQEQARNKIVDTMLKLRQKGTGASDVARGAVNPQKIKVTPELIEKMHEFFPEHPVVKGLKARLDASRAGKITQDFVETKPGETIIEKKLTPSEVTQYNPEQGNLFDKPYLDDVAAQTKPVSDFTAHPDRGISPTAPELQKPIEPNLAGSSSKIPANYQVLESTIPPEGFYEFEPQNMYDVFSEGNSQQSMWGKDKITHETMAKSKRFGEMMTELRNNIRSVEEPLTAEQVDLVKQFIPEFEGSTIGEGVKHLNEVTTETIGKQKILGRKRTDPLSFMSQVSKHGDKRAFAQALKEKHGFGDLLAWADEYGQGMEYAKALTEHSKKVAQYVAENSKGAPPFNPDLHAIQLMLGGPKLKLAYEAGKIVGSPAKQGKILRAAGSVGEKVTPSAYFNLKATPRPAWME